MITSLLSECSTLANTQADAMTSGVTSARTVQSTAKLRRRCERARRARRARRVVGVVGGTAKWSSVAARRVNAEWW